MSGEKENRSRERGTVMLGRKCGICQTAVVVITRYRGGAVWAPCPVCALLREEGVAERLELTIGGLYA